MSRTGQSNIPGVNVKLKKVESNTKEKFIMSYGNIGENVEGNERNKITKPMNETNYNKIVNFLTSSNNFPDNPRTGADLIIGGNKIEKNDNINNDSKFGKNKQEIIGGIAGNFTKTNFLSKKQNFDNELVTKTQVPVSSESKFSLYSHFTRELKKKNKHENSNSFVNVNKNFVSNPNYSHNNIIQKNTCQKEHRQVSPITPLHINTATSNNSYIDHRDTSLLTANTVKNQIKLEHFPHKIINNYITTTSDNLNTTSTKLTKNSINQSFNIFIENKKALHSNFQNLSKLKNKLKGVSNSTVNSGNHSRNNSIIKGKISFNNRNVNDSKKIGTTTKNSKTNLLELMEEINEIKNKNMTRSIVGNVNNKKNSRDENLNKSSNLLSEGTGKMLNRGINSNFVNKAKTRVVTANNSPDNSPREFLPVSRNIIYTNVGSRILTLNSELDETEKPEEKIAENLLKSVEISLSKDLLLFGKKEEIISDKIDEIKKEEKEVEQELSPSEKSEYLLTIDIMKNYIKMLQDSLENKTKQLSKNVKDLKKENTELKRENNNLHEKIKHQTKMMLNMYHEAKKYEETLKQSDKIYEKTFNQILEENKWLRAICEKEIALINAPLNRTLTKNLLSTPVKDKSEDLIYQIESEVSFKAPNLKHGKNKPKKTLNSTINFRGDNNEVKNQEEVETEDDKDEIPSKDSSSSLILVNPQVSNGNQITPPTSNTTDSSADNPSTKINTKLQKLSLYKTTPRLYLFHKQEKEIAPKYK